MKITVLGCGSAYGVPVIGGDWGACNPENPKNRRLCPSILIEDNNARLLVDMGPDFRQQAEQHNIRLLDGVFYTHGHADHITGNFHLPMLMRYYTDRNLPLYATRRTRQEIEKLWWFQNDPAINVEYSGSGRPLWHEIRPFYGFNVGGMDVMPFSLMHGRMECTGLRVGDFAYATDVNEIPEESFDHLQNLAVWIVECNCEFNKDKSHSYLEQTLAWIARVKPQRAILTHMDHTMDYDSISAKLPDGVELAYDGMEIVL